MAEGSKNFEHYRLYINTNQAFIEEKLQEIFKFELYEEYPCTRGINCTKMVNLAKFVMPFENNP